MRCQTQPVNEQTTELRSSGYVGWYHLERLERESESAVPTRTSRTIKEKQKKHV